MTTIKNISSDIALSSSDNKKLLFIDTSNEDIDLYLPYAIDIEEFEYKRIDTGSNHIIFHTKGNDIFEDNGKIFILSGANSRDRGKIVSNGNNKWWIGSDGEDNKETEHVPIIFGSVASGPPGQAPTLISISDTLLGIKMTSGSHKVYRTFKVPKQYLGSGSFHVHWTRSTLGNDLNKKVRWKISYKTINGYLEDIRTATTQIAEIEDTYENSEVSSSVVYGTSDAPVTQITASSYLTVRIEPVGPSGSALSDPVLVSLDFVYDKKVHKL